MTRTQLFTINGISSRVASMYSSKEPANSFGCPVRFRLPIRFRFAGFTFDSTSDVSALSFDSWSRKKSAFASKREIRDVPRMNSRIFCKSNTHH